MNDVSLCRLRTVCPLLAVGLTLLLTPSVLAQDASGTDDPPREIYAHLMGTYPVAAKATAWHRKMDPGRMRHDGKRQFDSFGDRWRNWPLVPDGTKLSLEEAADLEIRRAIRAGLDGFAMDAWAGGKDAKEYLDALFKVAEEKDYPIKLTVCLDAGQMRAVDHLLERHGDSPKLARRDGKPLIFGYLSAFPGFNYLGMVLAKEQGADNSKSDLWKQLRWDPKMRTSPEGWAHMVHPFEYTEQRLGQDIYFHYGMGAFFHHVPHDAYDDQVRRDAIRFIAERFEAVGAFLGSGEERNDEMAAIVKDAGAEWSEPMFYQYENIGWGGNRIRPGFDFLRSRWRNANENGSTLIQFVTWNDYTENTHLAPAYETRYAVMDLNRHYIQQWKTGQPITSDTDKIYLSYRKYPHGSTIYPFQPKRKDAGGVIEVVTILPEPATVRLPGREAEYHAPAGLHHQQFPLTAGPVMVELVRDGEVVKKLVSPEPVTDRPFREQNSMVAFSTEFEKHWQEEFPDTPPLIRGEYADDDNDGLPNWFEMYWFGEFLDWDTATIADPDADPNGDGKTNLEHYREQSDPLRDL